MNCSCVCKDLEEQRHEHIHEEHQHRQYAEDEDRYYQEEPTYTEEIQLTNPDESIDISNIENLIRLDKLKKLEDELLDEQEYVNEHVREHAAEHVREHGAEHVREHDSEHTERVRNRVRNHPRVHDSEHKEHVRNHVRNHGRVHDSEHDVIHDQELAPPLLQPGDYPTPEEINYDNYDTMMDKKIKRVIGEVDKFERKTRKKMSPSQLKSVCACINDEYCLSKPSLLNLQETHEPKLTEQVVNGIYSNSLESSGSFVTGNDVTNNASGTYGYASV